MIYGLVLVDEVYLNQSYVEEFWHINNSDKNEVYHVDQLWESGDRDRSAGWGLVTDTPAQWTRHDGDVVCRQLGFSRFGACYIFFAYICR